MSLSVLEPNLIAPFQATMTDRLLFAALATARDGECDQHRASPIPNVPDLDVIVVLRTVNPLNGAPVA